MLSKEAVRRLVLYALPSKEKCRQGNEGVEDAELGKVFMSSLCNLLHSRLELIVVSTSF